MKKKQQKKIEFVSSKQRFYKLLGKATKPLSEEDQRKESEIILYRLMR